MTPTPGHSSFLTRKHYKRSASILYIGQIDYFPAPVRAPAEFSLSNHRKVPLCSLFSYSERSTVTQRVTFVLLAALTTLTMALPLAGCGGQDTTPTEEKEANVEKEEEAAAPDEAPVEALPAYEPGQDTDTEICQTGEALQDLGPEGLQGLTDELSEEVAAGRFANMQEALASRGYTCNGQVG